MRRRRRRREVDLRLNSNNPNLKGGEKRKTAKPIGWSIQASYSDPRKSEVQTWNNIERINYELSLRPFVDHLFCETAGKLLRGIFCTFWVN